MFFYNSSRCADENRKPRVADFGDRVEDSSFLNQLQNGVNRWIKEIQKVFHSLIIGFHISFFFTSQYFNFI